jgi:LysR family transcriptional regulator, nitrogen assimilation regulatory protein
MEFRQLRSFVRIVDLGSVSRAAGALHIAQSALSQQVAALEAELRTPLLHRSSRGVTPTEAGRQLYQHAQAILKQSEDAKTAVAECSSEPTGLVVLGVPLSLVAPLALPIFNAVRSSHPRIRLQILEELSGTILEWVKNGRLSLGIAFDDGNLEGLSATPIIEERLFLIVPPKSPLARRKVVSLRGVATLDLVLPTPDQGVRSRIDRAMARAGHAIGHVVAEVNSLTLMKQCAAAGIGATVLSWPSVEAEVAQGQVAAIEIARPSITRIATLCVLASAPRSRAVDCVVQQTTAAICDTIRRRPWRGVRFIGAD